MTEKILKQFIPVAEMIGKMLGSACEVVIHDLTNPEHSVIYTVNNTVTGRQIGESFHHLVQQVLLSDELANDMVANYYFETPDKRIIKSATALIKDTNSKVIGALCVNIDTSVIKPHLDWLNSLLPDINNATIIKPALKPENKEPHINDIVTDIIENILNKRDITAMKREEKIEVIRFMDDRGIFLIKGAIDKVAEKMSISKVTIYSYLDELKKS